MQSVLPSRPKDFDTPKFLNLSIVEENPELVILANEMDGVSLTTTEGPLRSVMDQSVMPVGEFSSQYSVQKLSTIIINIA